MERQTYVILVMCGACRAPQQPVLLSEYISHYFHFAPLLCSVARIDTFLDVKFLSLCVCAESNQAKEMAAGIASENTFSIHTGHWRRIDRLGNGEII